MAIFRLSSIVTVSAFTTVEADSFEEACEIAEERDVVLDIQGLNGLMMGAKNG